MSNTCNNALVLTGPGAERDRFVADVTGAQPWELLAVHVPLNGRTPADGWGTGGVKYSVDVSRHDEAATQNSICVSPRICASDSDMGAPG